MGEADRRFTPTRVGSCISWSTARWKWAVHPHSRGELLSAAVRVGAFVGSPPLAWGVGVQGHGFARGGRFTPTRVGSCYCVPEMRKTPAVHPHSRGELRKGGRVLPDQLGSPPLAWGVDPARLREHRQDRFTPTRVGSCFGVVVHVVDVPGSPPLAWGVDERGGDIPLSMRFTPTRVGSWPRSFLDMVRSAVHPHSRGELYIDVISYPPRSGSPPLAWGVGLAGGWALAGQRFTPTRVGSWMWINFNARCASVHPHSRGELSSKRIAPKLTADFWL